MSTEVLAGPAPDVLAARVLDVELHDALPVVEPRGRVDAGGQLTWLLVRLFGEPLGWCVLAVPAVGLGAAELTRTVVASWGGEVAVRLGPEAAESFARGRLSAPELLAAARAATATPYLRVHEAFLQHAPRCAVAICTRDRPDDLRRCLDSLVTQDHPDFGVWVVDNDPTTPATRAVVEGFAGRLDIHYVPELRPGLSRARNTLLEQDLGAEVLAWLDDDTVADQRWLAELARAFDGRPEVSASSGPVVPGELDTPAQLMFEQFGGQTKGRGFSEWEFSPATREVQSPLYPLPVFGVGANMAFRVSVLRGLGGFDEALGAGTRSHGSEDTRVFTEILRRGGTVRYLPTPLTRHYHRRDRAGLKKQMYGYGCGLTAFYTALVVDDPAVLWPLLRLAGRALREVSSTSSLRHSTMGTEFPPDLLAANRRGMIEGPGRYLQQRLVNRRELRRGGG